MAGMHDDPQRAIHNLIRFGTVIAVDHAEARVTVQLGDLVTRPLPWLTARAGDVTTWCPPSAGEQVVVLSPGGNPASGVVLPAVFSNTRAKPMQAGASNAVIAFDDGAVLLYDQATHQLTGTLPAGGKVALTAPGGFALTGPVDIDGPLHVSQDVTLDTKLTAGEDVIAGTVSLVDHKHTGVTAGQSLTGKPQP